MAKFATLLFEMIGHEILLLTEAVPAERFRGIARFAKEAGWHMTIEDRPRHNPPVGWKGDGAIVMLEDNESYADYIRLLRRRGTVIVNLTANRPDIRLPRVLGDGQAVGRLAATHFKERGFKHIAWFSAEWSTGHRQRMDGLISAWTEEHVMQWIFPQDAPVGGKSLTDWLWKRISTAPKPLAVFCYNDYDAADVINVCLRHDIQVPANVSVLGVDDNSVLCETQPIPISSVRYDHESVGYESAKLLEKLINADSQTRRAASFADPILIQPLGITVRESSDTIAATNPLVKAALAYISENLSKSFGGQEIADFLKVPRARLDRAFAADINRSVGSEIRRQRIELVKKKLASSDDSIGEISRQTGYCNASFMIKSFAEETHITPRLWREQINQPFVSARIKQVQ